MVEILVMSIAAGLMQRTKLQGATAPAQLPLSFIFQNAVVYFKII